ncbi:hypothetical protein MUP32_03500 [Candidatus Microgenomates bacterium]|nr:hypothetical protein [Candidatus Microgenomates bacterium]
MVKYIFLAIILVILSVMTIRLFSGEDDWMCQNGQWVKHSQPSSPMPQTECR